jgi:hypothetical protein
MNPEFVTRILKLIDKTGDKVVMMDPQSDRAIVVMDLEQYESLVAARPDVAPAVAPTPPAAAESEPTPTSEPTPAPVLTQPVEPTPEPIQPTNQEQPFILEDDPTPESAPISQPVEAPTPTPQPDLTPDPQKPSVYSNPGQKDPLAVSAFTDLTQSELLDKINRDIATWKTAQDRKRTDELKSAVSAKQTAKVPAEATDSLEDEERFYLEPVE